MNSFSIRREALGEGLRLSLVGDFTEDTDFSAILQEEARPLVFDLAEVKRINSCGVREWISLVMALSRRGTPVVFERCSVAFVNQLNMISNFRAGATVRSLYAPYYCVKCDADHVVLLPADERLRSRLDEKAGCPQCSGPMDFDDVPDSYVSFLD